jgi:hypothetical protein
MAFWAKTIQNLEFKIFEVVGRKQFKIQNLEFKITFRRTQFKIQNLEFKIPKIFIHRTLPCANDAALSGLAGAAGQALKGRHQ